MRKTTLDKVLLPWISDIPSSRRGRFPQIDSHRFPLSIDKNHLIANDFIGYSGMQLHPELHQRVEGLNREKLDAFKPGQYQPSEEDFKASFKEKVTFF